MSTDISNNDSMKDAMKMALQRNHKATPATISRLFKLLGEVQEALREDGYSEAVLELRKGLLTDYGQRYTVYIRDDEATFESLLFSIFADHDKGAFQAEGQIQSGLNAEIIISRAREYLLRADVIEFMTGLLNQFGRKDPAGALVANPSDN